MRALLAFLAAAGFSASLAAQASEPPLSLDQAIRLALEKNRSIKVEAYGPQIARANWLTAVGQFDPALVFRRSQAKDGAPTGEDPLIPSQVKSDDYSLALEGMTPWGLNYSLGGSATNQRGTFNNFAGNYASFGGVTFTQPLLRGFGFGANLVNVRVARANRSISEWDYRQTVIDTVTNVVIAYSNLAFAQDEVRITRRARDLAISTVADHEKRVVIGSGPQSDVITAKAQAATRDDSILLAERSLHTADNQLRDLIGESVFTADQAPLPIQPPPLPEIVVDPAADLQKAFLCRPDYQAARLGIVLNRASAAAAGNQLLPQVDFVGSYGYNGLDRNFQASRRMVADRENHSYSAGVVVSIPLTFAQGRGRARAARLQLRQSEEDLRRFEADIAMSVANAAGQIETARQRVVADRAAYDLASQALDAEVKKFRAGSSNTQNVLQQQNLLIGAESSVASALAAQRQALASYDRELGTTLTRYHIALSDK